METRVRMMLWNCQIKIRKDKKIDDNFNSKNRKNRR